jgi:hypothetical protein
MRQLARTLLILGSVTACERAHPDSEPAPRAQTKLETPSRLATPLVDVNGSPAVGNIGQTGAPTAAANIDVAARAADLGAECTWRAQRVVRAATIPRPGVTGLADARLEGVAAHPDPLQRPDPDVDLTRPDLPPRVAPSRTTRLEFQRDDSAKLSLTQERPLVNRRERPAHANMGRRAHIAERDE